MEFKPKKRVLVIEDEPNWQELISELVQEIACELDYAIEIVTISRFTEVMDKIAAMSYDCITLDNELLDGSMARMVLSYISRLDYRAPVVVISGKINPNEVRDFFKEYSIVEFFWKRDFDPRQFKRTISEIISQVELTPLGAATRVEYSIIKRFFSTAGFDVEHITKTTDVEEFLLNPKDQDHHPYAHHGPIYARLIAGRPPTGDDFTTVCRSAQQHYGDDLAHRVALVISEQRPEPWARYRLYEIRQQYGLAIVPLDSSLFVQIKPHRTASDILASEIDQATGQQNLYAISGPVSGDFSFFGRERILEKIIGVLNTGQPVGLFGLRKVGKTSLVQRVQGRLARQRPVAFVDTQGTVRQQGVWPLYAAIIAAFSAHLQRARPDIALPKLNLYPEAGPLSPAIAGSFLQDLRLLHTALGRPSKKERMLLVVDEIDRLLPCGKTPGYEGFVSFWGQLRAANQREHLLDFVVIGVDPLVNLQERWQNHDNELYRALCEIWMPPLAPGDVREMIDSLGLQMGVHYEPEALRLLEHAGGGQPFVTRQMCSLALEGRLGRGGVTVTLDQAQAAIEEFVFRDSYLPELWRTRLDDRQREMLRALAQTSEPTPRIHLLPAAQRQTALAALDGLEKRTLVHWGEGGYTIAWDVFRDWIRWVELGLEE